MITPRRPEGPEEGDKTHPGPGRAEPAASPAALTVRWGPVPAAQPHAARYAPAPPAAPPPALLGSAQLRPGPGSPPRGRAGAPGAPSVRGAGQPPATALPGAGGGGGGAGPPPRRGPSGRHGWGGGGKWAWRRPLGKQQRRAACGGKGGLGNLLRFIYISVKASKHAGPEITHGEAP